jgi:hypothetical protein
MSGRRSVLLIGLSLAGLLPAACRPSVFDGLSSDLDQNQADAGTDAGEDRDASAAQDGSTMDAATDAGPEMDASSCGDTTSDPEHCGDCATRCVPPDDGFATCQRSACREHRLSLNGAKAGPLRGGTGGGAFETAQLCTKGEVMIGLSGKADERIMYGLAVHCARFAITSEAQGYAVSVISTTTADELGGLIEPAPPAYKLLCPAGEIVTAIAGATWLWPSSPTASVRQLSISCARVAVDPEGKVILERSSKVLSVGDQEDASAETFSDVCDAESGVAGLSGRSGAYIDAISVHCGKVELQERGGKTMTRDE